MALFCQKNVFGSLNKLSMVRLACCSSTLWCNATRGAVWFGSFTPVVLVLFAFSSLKRKGGQTACKKPSGTLKLVNGPANSLQHPKHIGGCHMLWPHPQTQLPQTNYHSPGGISRFTWLGLETQWKNMSHPSFSPFRGLNRRLGRFHLVVLPGMFGASWGPRGSCVRQLI